MKDNLELLHDRYARALYQWAVSNGMADEIMRELSVISTEWFKDEKFHTFLTHPLITSEEKKVVVERIARKKKCCHQILDFLKVIIDNKRENLLNTIFLRYRDIYEESKNKIRVYVETPRPLSRQEEWRLKDVLKIKFSASTGSISGSEDVAVEVRENPELISGLFVRYRDSIYDNSIRGQLNKLERELEG